MKRDEEVVLAHAIDAVLGTDNSEEISHHEECLEAALTDMQRHRPRPSPYVDFDRSYHWAEINAHKHYAALERMRGYRMPEYLSAMYDDLLGPE